MLRLTGLAGIAEDEVYRVEVTAISAAAQFRAEPRAVWPRIYGTEHGTVDGEADSEYAQLDEHGRYLVRFAFDESDLGDGKASTRVRMMQPHGGGVEGWHFPLRKGTEVLFTFLGGDPDRPVIAGVVPNALTPSPVTKGNQTRNVIQTGGRNRWRSRTKRGSSGSRSTTPYANTMIRMGSPNAHHEMILRTDGNAKLDCMDWDVDVHGHLFENVTGPVCENYKAGHGTTIEGGRIEIVQTGGMQTTISGGWTHTVTGGGGTMDIDGGLKVLVTGNAITTVSADVENIVSGSETHIVGAGETHIVGGTVTTNYGPWNGTFTKLNWVVPGSVEISTPIVTEVKGHSQEFIGGSFEATGGLIESVGIHVESVGIHVETIAMHVETVGFHYAPGSAKLRASEPPSQDRSRKHHQGRAEPHQLRVRHEDRQAYQAPGSHPRRRALPQARAARRRDARLPARCAPRAPRRAGLLEDGGRCARRVGRGRRGLREGPRRAARRRQLLRAGRRPAPRLPRPRQGRRRRQAPRGHRRPLLARPRRH